MPHDTLPELQQKLDFFAASPENRLTLIYPGYEPTVNGNSVTKTQGEDEPTMKLPPSKADPSKTYLVVYYDPDPPKQYGQCLHWVQTDMRAAADGTLSYSTPFLVDHRGPNPPAGTDAHRYTFIVYEQPPSFDVEKHRMAPKGEKVPVFDKRIHFLLEDYEKELGLGEPVAGIYFECQQ